MLEGVMTFICTENHLFTNLTFPLLSVTWVSIKAASGKNTSLSELEELGIKYTREIWDSMDVQIKPLTGSPFYHN